MTSKTKKRPGGPTHLHRSAPGRLVAAMLQFFLFVAPSAPGAVWHCARVDRDVEQNVAPARVTACNPRIFESLPVPTEAIARERDATHYQLKPIAVSDTLTLKDSRSGATFTTSIEYRDPETGTKVSGSVSRTIAGDTMELDFAYLDPVMITRRGDAIAVPSWIDLPGVVPLVPGRGIPTTAFLTLRQMKMAGVRPGQLKKVRTTVDNRLALAEYEVAKRAWHASHPGEAPTAANRQAWVRGIHTVRYTETALNQGPGRISISQVDVTEHPRVPVDDLLATVRDDTALSVRADARRVALFQDEAVARILATGLSAEGTIAPKLELVMTVQ